MVSHWKKWNGLLLRGALTALGLIALLALPRCGTISGQPASNHGTLPGAIIEDDPAAHHFDIATTPLNDEQTAWEIRVTSAVFNIADFSFAWMLDGNTRFNGSVITIDFELPGTYRLTLTVSRRSGEALFTTYVDVEVPETDRAPVADAGDDQTVPENELVFLYGDASYDPQGRELTFLWTQTFGPTVLIMNEDQAIAQFISPLAEQMIELQFRLQVSNGEQSSEDRVTVYVNNSFDFGGDPDSDSHDPDLVGDGSTVIDGAGADPVPCTVTDSDGDGSSDCADGCPTDPNKTSAGICGCGSSDADANTNGTPDCLDTNTPAGTTLQAYAGANASIIVGQSVTLTGTALNGTPPYTFAWSPAGMLNNANSAQPVATPTVTTTFVLVVQDAAGQSAQDDVEIEVVAPLVANAGPDVTINAGASTTLAGSATGGTPPYTYLWSPASGLSSTTISNPVASPTSTRTYTLTVTDFRGRTASDGVVVTVLNFTANAGSDVSIPAGGSTTLSGSATNGVPPYTYQWSPATGLNNPASASPTASPAVTTTYTLTARDALNNTATDSVVVTVQPAAAVLSVSPSSIFFGSTTTTATMQVWNSGGGTLNYSLSDNQSWLTTSPTSGSSTGEQDTITVTVNRAGLADGNYEGVITVTPTLGTVATLAVSMIVGTPGFGTMSTASRSSGVAPLAVFFDAVDPANGVVQPPLSGGRRDYTGFQYRWNFGDNPGATWATDGRSKNEAYGQVAAHVYENPGAYTVTLVVTQPSGTTTSYSQQITVQDPEVVYANSSPNTAERTFYVASEGSDTNNGSFNAPFRTWAHARSRLFAANGPRRVLLKRGQTFTHSTNSTISNRTGPYTIGAYGSGANPVIQHAGGTGEALALDASATDVRVVDVNFSGSHAGNAIRPGTNTLVLRSTFTSMSNAISTSELYGNRARNFFVDCSIVDSLRYGIYYNFGMHVAVLGTTIDNVSEEHLMRSYITRSVVSHNVFRGGRINKHQLKFCGFFPTGNPERSPGTPTEAVENTVISCNRFEHSGPINWMITIGPVDQNKDQRIEGCVFERNLVKSDTATNVMLYANNNHNAVRNNIFDASVSPSGVSAIRVTRRGIEPDPVGYMIYHNTMYRPGSGNLVAVQIDSMAQNTQVRNNLASASAGTIIQGGGSGLLSQGNVMTASAGFVNAAAGNFNLLPSSSAVDAGVNVPSVAIDYNGAQRPFDGNSAGGPQWDIGAFEYRNNNPVTNVAPSVNAGPNQQITLPTNMVNLDATVTDDGLPNPPAFVTVLWTKVSGPGTVTFGNASSVDTTAVFSTAGAYVLRLTANDSALSSFADVTVTVNQGAAANPERLGINLSKVYGWGTQIAFVDAFKQSRPWISANADGTNSNTGVAVPTDADGYPLQIPYNNGVNPPQIVRTTMLDVDAGTYPAGTYTLIFTGNGTISLSNSASGTFNQTGGTNSYPFLVANPTASGVQLRITRSEASDRVRDIRVIMPGHLNTYTTQPFYPAFLTKLQGFGAIRFMEWTRTNGNDHLVSWSDRTTPTSVTQAGPKGAAFEHAVQLANAVGADPWFCIPHRADEGFITELARLIRDTLSPQRKVYVEYSNEVWNGMFEQSAYARDQGLALGLGPDPVLATRRYYAKRSAEIFRIFQNEFGAQQNRVVRVLSGQAASSNVLSQIMQAFQQPSINGVSINPTGATATALAIAPYFGNGLADSIVANNEVNSITVAEILNRLNTTYLPLAVERMQQNKAVADQYGLPLIAYEGGQHLAATGNNVNNATLTQKLHDANRAAGMYTLYRDYFDAWFAAGGGVFAHYAFTQAPNQYGFWGALEHLGQTTTDAPKYRALVDVIALPD